MRATAATNSTRDQEFELATSRLLILALLSVAGLALVAIWVLHATIWLRVILAVSVLTIGYLALRDIALMSGSAIVSMRSLYTERAWLLRMRSGYRCKAIQCDARVFRHLVLLTVKEVNRNQTKTVLVTSQALSAEKHRQLRSLVLAMQSSGDH